MAERGDGDVPHGRGARAIEFDEKSGKRLRRQERLQTVEFLFQSFILSDVNFSLHSIGDDVRSVTTKETPRSKCSISDRFRDDLHTTLTTDPVDTKCHILR